MAHKSQRRFCIRVKEKFPEFFVGKSVLDVGSFDINGNNRIYFDDCRYLGVDVTPGPNVDLVTPVHELDKPDGAFDVIISTECFEHDMHVEKSLARILRLLKPGGLFLFTCATTGRKEHGTSQAKPGDSPATVSLGGDWADYYRNVPESEVREVIDPDANFSDYEFDYHKGLFDLYFWGVKRQAPKGGPQG